MNNLFKNIFAGLEKFKGGNEENAVGIDIGSSMIKVVEIKKKGGKAILETYGAIALGPYDLLDAGRVTNLSVEKVSEALKEVLKQSGVNNISPAFSIPRLRPPDFRPLRFFCRLPPGFFSLSTRGVFCLL